MTSHMDRYHRQILLPQFGLARQQRLARSSILLIGCGALGTVIVDQILDGTDNVETRYLVNDVAIKRDIPWVYGACVGTTGRVMGIIPHQTPCLRCIFPDLPAPGELPTCDTAGVLASAANIV